MSIRIGRALAVLAAGGAGAAAVILALAPADLAGVALSALTGGHVALEEAAGTVWEGSARILIGSGGASRGDAGADANARGATSYMRLPGRCAWRIRPWRLLLGTLDLTLSEPDSLEGPLAVHVDRAGNATIEAGRLRLPADALASLGAPWNTIRPGGALTLEWDALHAHAGGVQGALRAEWSDASSGLSPVAPFGHYRIVMEGLYDGARVRLETLAGPMEMTGNGTIAGGLHLRFRGRAQVRPGTDPAVASQLAGLISLLGLRDGEGAILNFEM